MRIDIHSGYRITMIQFVSCFTLPLILGSVVGIVFDYPFTTVTIALIVFIIPLIIFNIWAIKYYKPISDGTQGLIYYYLETNDDNSITLISDKDEIEIVQNITMIIYFKIRIIDFILSIEGGQMPQNLKIIYDFEGKQLEKFIGSITKKELIKLKGNEMIYIKKRGKLIRY